MSRRLPQSVYLPVLTSVVVVAGLSTYYLVSQNARARYLDERAFRALNSLGRAVSDTREHVRTVLGASTDEPADSASAYVESQLTDFAARSVARRGRPRGRNGLLELAAPEPSAGFTVIATYRTDLTDQPRDRERQRNGDGREWVRATVDLGSVLDKRMQRLSGAFFDTIVIADASGAVWYRQSASDILLTNLGPLLDERPDAEVKPIPTGDRSVVTPAEVLRTRASWEGGRQVGHSRAIDRTIGGSPYRVYLAPLPVTFIGGARRTSLMIAALRRADREDDRTLAVPHAFVIWSVLAILSSFTLLWPILKLFYMSPKERLRHTHVAYLLSAMVVGTALLALTVLNVSYVLQARRETDARLRELANAIRSNVTNELTHAADLLAATAPDTLPQPDQARSGFVSIANATVRYRDQLKAYPYVQYLFWTDQQGQQQLKFSASPRATPRTVVREAYFRDVVDNRLATLTLSNGRKALVRAEAVFSPNTYEFFVVMGMPQPGLSSQYAAKVLVTRLESLNEAVLPPGYGFAVVDPAGNVKMHSNSSYNLQQNFLQETRRDSRLALLLARAGHAGMSLDYLGRSHRVYVSKLTDIATTPLSLIAFREEETFSTINVAVVVVFAMLMLAYIAPLIVAVSGYLTRRIYPLDGLWPCPTRLSVYCDLLPKHLIVLTAFALSYGAASPLEALLLWPLLCLAAGLLFPWLLAREREPRLVWGVHVAMALGLALVGRSTLVTILALLFVASGLTSVVSKATKWLEPLSLRRIYAAVTTTEAAVLVIAPAFAFFQFAATSVERVALAREQLLLARSIQARTERIREQFAPLKLEARDHPGDVKTIETLERERLAESLDRYDLGQSGLPPRAGRGDDWRLNWFERKVVAACARLRPGAIGLELLHVAVGSLNDSDREWTVYRHDSPESPRAARAALVLNVAAASTPMRIASPMPVWSGLEAQAAVAMFFVLVLLYQWFSFLTATIFLVDLENAPALEVWDVATAASEYNLLVIGPPRSGRRLAISGLKDIDLIDLPQIARRKAWNRIATTKNRVALYYFDFDLDDAETSRKKLELLERLVYVERKGVILLSAVDPMHYLSQPGTALGLGDANGNGLDRWANVLSRLRKVRLRDTNEPVFNTPRFTERSSRKARRALCVIRRECEGEKVLEAIGSRVLARVQEDGLSDDALIEVLLDAADSYYRLLWSTCTAEERLVLFQLAHDGWTNHRNSSSIQQLQRRRLVVRPRGLRVMNESFRRFVLRSQYPLEVRRWEQEEHDSKWRAVRLSLAAAVTLCAAWALYTHPPVASVLVGSLTLLGATVGGFVKVFGDLRSQIGVEAASRKPA